MSIDGILARLHIKGYGGGVANEEYVRVLEDALGEGLPIEGIILHLAQEYPNRLDELCGYLSQDRGGPLGGVIDDILQGTRFSGRA